MELITQTNWHPSLSDPIGMRTKKPRSSGKTMIIDKGLGLNAFEDLLQISSNYIDMIKLGFGTPALYTNKILKRKIELAKSYDVHIFPGGTFLEVAVTQSVVDLFFETVHNLGFTGIEVSDGTIEMNRSLRNELILRGLDSKLTVFTEYGKKCWGSRVEIEQLMGTIHLDIEHGASMVTVEGRESGTGVGIFDEKGECREDEIREIYEMLPNQNLILWEAPLKSQQVNFIKIFGTEVNLGNIAPDDILSLESLRRGLRSDTFTMKRKSHIG
jgi:phosphosulfolactate synthase